MSLISHCTTTFQMRKLKFTEIEPIAKVLETISGSALSHPALALACGCDLQSKPDDALPSFGPQFLLFLLCSTLTVLRGDIQPSPVLGSSPL